MIYSFSPFGYEGSLVNVEVDLRRGIPATDIVGLSDGAVKETRERMQAAIRNSGFEYPQERVLISLSPAGLKKEGAGFDLPIALGVLESVAHKQAVERAEKTPDERVLVMGELELSGHVRPVKAIHSACTSAIEASIEYAIIPKGSDIPTGIKYCEVETLEEAYRALVNIGSSEYFKEKGEDIFEGFSTKDKALFEDYENNFDEIEGMEGLKFAMAVAVAGHHNLLVWGSPGCGKTMTLQHLPLLTPKLTFKESQSASRIWSFAGLMKPNVSYIKVRPFRMPHQTASIEGICGGGPNCRPGEVSLAHNGTLFIDEAAEFRSSVLQMLRIPLENHSITLARAGRATIYPANFQLVMASNPCPCGNYGNKERVCLCSEKSIEQYWAKFSHPLLDKMAIRYDCNNPLEYTNYTLEELREIINTSWTRQMKRQGKLNDELTPQEIALYIVLSEDAKEVLKKATEKYGYSPRAVSYIQKVAKTIQDMQNDEAVSAESMKVALQLRGSTYLES